MPEVPHNWSLGLRRPLVALLGAVAVEEIAGGLCKPQTPKNMVQYLLSCRHISIFC